MQLNDKTGNQLGRMLISLSISIDVPGVKAAWADTLDRDLLLPECRANEVHRGVGLDHCQGQLCQVKQGELAL
ncbi:hypothetical protein EYF80_013759 [Liparis tanakae]|uniref:Uncharacterized protein n=1 Tax=Liparis tanakae TaxID=230148 RepID=A0A4Z2IDG7_9TELE|nr:hypothetical protein EYF80_013759 [Liparis tanakae]